MFESVTRIARMTEFCADLIGSNLPFCHGKVSSKLPGTATEIKWHQDFLRADDQ